MESNATGLPNLLTISRIAIIPVVLVFIYIPGQSLKLTAAIIFMLACVTDFLDGYFARKLDQSSALGRFLDPIADKLLVAGVIVALVSKDVIAGLSVVPALVILFREILVSGLREYLAELHVPVPVSKLAKWKTAIQMFALGALIFDGAMDSGQVIYIVGMAGLWVAAILTIVTGYDYLKASLKHF